MRDKTNQSFDNILSVFSGEDGGVQFYKFKCFIEDMDNRASQPLYDKAAQQIINQLHIFNRMIMISQR